jgi:hypothetical protein
VTDGGPLVNHRRRICQYNTAWFVSYSNDILAPITESVVERLTSAKSSYSGNQEIRCFYGNPKAQGRVRINPPPPCFRPMLFRRYTVWYSTEVCWQDGLRPNNYALIYILLAVALQSVCLMHVVTCHITFTLQQRYMCECYTLCRWMQMLIMQGLIDWLLP